MFHHPEIFGKQELDILMSHLKNEVFSTHARRYCCSYHKLPLSKELSDPFHDKGLKTSQLSAVVHHFTPGADVGVPALYQEHIKSS